MDRSQRAAKDRLGLFRGTALYNDGGFIDVVLCPQFRKVRKDPRWGQMLASINLPPDLQLR